MKTTCDRCAGSGELGVRNRFSCAYEAPGPVPEDARGWYAIDCPDCGGEGERIIYDYEEEDA